MELTAGLCLFHNGTPYELLYRLAEMLDWELWKVKPLFVEDQTSRDVLIRKGDHLSLLYTQRAV